MNCDQLSLAATELALGALSGTERAAALAHMGNCRACRHRVEELTELAGHLLLLAPEDEPSPGFETRVISALAAAGMGEGTRLAALGSARGRAWRSLAAAAVAAALVGSAAIGAWTVRRSDHRTVALTHEYVSALHTLGGSSLRAAKLCTPDGAGIGQVFVYEGAPSWMFVSIDRDAPDGDYTLELFGHIPGPWSVTGLKVTDGRGALGRTAWGDVRLLTGLVVTDASGHTRYIATLGRRACDR